MLTLTREEALALIERYPYIRAITAQNEVLRAELYQTALSDADPLEWARVDKSCYIRAHNAAGDELELPEAEKHLWQCAKERLYSLLADALGISPDSVPEFIEKHNAEDF